MAKNKDGFEAGQPLTFEELAAVERKKRRAAIDAAAAPKAEPKPKRRLTPKKDAE